MVAVDTTPVLRIPFSPLLDRPNRGIVLADHSMLVISHNGQGMVGFDSTGRVRWRHRITPAGSGGFAYFSDLLRDADGRGMLWDHMLHRVSTLDAKGSRLSQRRLTSLPPVMLNDGSRTSQFLTLRGSFSNGTLLATTSSDAQADGEITWDSVDVYRFDVRGSRQVIGRVLLAQRFSRTAPYLVQGRVPFGRAGQLAVRGSSWYYTDGSAFRIERRGIDGRMNGVFTTDRERRPVNADAIRRSRIRALLAVDTTLRRSLYRALETMPYPDSMPAYTDLRFDATGLLWARIGQPEWEPGRWDLFHPARGFLVQVVIPPNLRVLDIGHTRLLAAFENPGAAYELHAYGLCRG
jgi:hypothetical protein